MSTAAYVDIDMDVGADFGVQIYWTDANSSPFTVLSPMRMEIRADTGTVMYALQTDDDSPADAFRTILYNRDSGLIQLTIPATETVKFAPGEYNYDLFVTYMDNTITSSTRLRRLIAGKVHVNGRVTQNVGA